MEKQSSTIPCVWAAASVSSCAGLMRCGQYDREQERDIVTERDFVGYHVPERHRWPGWHRCRSEICAVPPHIRSGMGINMTKNIMIVGVGGQGSLLASKLLGHLFLSEGYDVKVSEVHGMSQRGGSVVTYVRYGEKVYSPIIDKGQADFIVSFEKLEAARYLEYLKKDGQVVVNTQEIDPMPVIAGAAEYPERLIEKMQEAGIRIDALDCLELAGEAGSSKAVNIVLLGRLSRYFDIPMERWQKAIEECVPPRFVAMNQKAFLLGRGNYK